MAYVDTAACGQDSYAIDVRGKLIHATPVPLPFYKR